MSQKDVNEAANLCAKMANSVHKYPLMKTFESILNNGDALKHPRENKSGKPYYDFICLSFDQIRLNIATFRERVNQHLSITPMPTTYKEYEQFTQYMLDSCDSIQDVLKEIFVLGNKDQGYAKLKSFLDNHKSDVDVLNSFPQMPGDDSIKYLYRFANKTWSKKDRKSLFHPPFEANKSNHLNYRYSGEEFPSLYLGCSLDVCFAEVNAENKDDFFAAQFRLCDGETLSVLNLGYRWEEMSVFCFSDVNDKKKLDFFKGWFSLYPLMLASSIVKKSETKDEYIVPQFLMRYIKESTDLDGIRYYSTKRCYIDAWTKKSLNFAFPAKSDKKEGYDDFLTKKFELTEPVDLACYADLNEAKIALSNQTYGILE
jgi:hypothetical protein